MTQPPNPADYPPPGGYPQGPDQGGYTPAPGSYPPPPGAYPPPQVDAAFVSARRRDAPLLPADAAEPFARFVAAGFRRGAGRQAPVEEWIRAFRRAQSRK